MNEARNDQFGGHHPLTGIKAILFDIYGTLLGSTAGEIHPDPELRALIAEALSLIHI